MIKHRQFDEVRQWLDARVPVWLWGAPGAGKTHLAEQLATEMGLGFHPVYLGPTTTESKLLGFRNASLGEYVKGLVVDAYVEGGLLYLDEIDNCDPSVLVAINALLANGTYRFPDGEVRQRHPTHFVVLAGANTLGTGSTQGFKRNAQDAASRSRFAKVEFEYDEELELVLSDGQTEWCSYVQRVRKYIKTLAKCNLWITTRDVLHGARALNAGISPERVLASTVFAEMQQDVKSLVVRNCGVFGNRPKVEDVSSAKVQIMKEVGGTELSIEPPPAGAPQSEEGYPTPPYWSKKKKHSKLIDPSQL